MRDRYENPLENPTSFDNFIKMECGECLKNYNIEFYNNRVTVSAIPLVVLRHYIHYCY